MTLSHPQPFPSSPSKVFTKHHLKMNNYRLLLLISSLSVPATEGFILGRNGNTRIESVNGLKYINGEELPLNGPSVTLPPSQAIHRRKQQQQQTNRITSEYCRVDASSISRDDETEYTRRHQHFNNRHSSADWLHNLKTLPNSSVLREVRNPVMALTVWGTLLSAVHHILVVKGKAQLAMNMAVPMVAHSLLVSSLGLLLVFRTNSSYQRFLEGRKIWEKISTLSRNISRLASLYRDEIGEKKLLRMKKLLASFPYLLRHHIRSGCLCSTDPESVDDRYKLQLDESCGTYIDSRYEGDHDAQSSMETLGECFVDRRDLPWSLLEDRRGETLRRIARSDNRPLWICDRLGFEIKNFNLDSRERLTLLKGIDDLSSTIGQCERIRQTAVPLNYARHALRSLTLWLFTLPFCMVKDLGLLTGPATGIIAWVLFGIYQIGYEIEDPFQKSLRLSIFCDAIRRDVLGVEELGERTSAFYIEEYGEESSLLDVIPESRGSMMSNGLDDNPRNDFIMGANEELMSTVLPLLQQKPVLAAMQP